MRHSVFTLRVLATLTLSTASALPQHGDQGILESQTFSCSGEQSLSLCCTRSLPANGAVQDCQESMHFMIGPTRLSANDYSRKLHSTTVHQCSSEQLNEGYNRPVCCKAGFKPSAGAPGYNGMNCIKGAVDGGSRWSFAPKGYPSESSSGPKRDVDSKFSTTNPLSSAVETIPVAGDAADPTASREYLTESRSSPSRPSAELDSLLSDLDLPFARRSLQKRARRPFAETEPSGSGHQTQDAVLKDLLTSTSLTQLRRRNSRTTKANGL